MCLNGGVGANHAIRLAIRHRQSPNAPPLVVGRASPFGLRRHVAALKRGDMSPRSRPPLPTGGAKHSQADAGNHGARPRLRIQVAACHAKESVPVEPDATAAARCGERALSPLQNPKQSCSIQVNRAKSSPAPAERCSALR